MSEPLAVELPPETRRILQHMADVGLLGATPGEVAAYLILREIDDLMRAKVLSLSSVEAETLCPYAGQALTWGSETVVM